MVKVVKFPAGSRFVRNLENQSNPPTFKSRLIPISSESRIYNVRKVSSRDNSVLFYLEQVVYVTATFPYLVLVIFFFRGITLKGFDKGLEYLFVPEVRLIYQLRGMSECMSE